MPHPQIKIVGETPEGNIRAIAVNSDGSLPISGGPSSGGDASAANQQMQTSLLEIIRDRLIDVASYTDNLETLIASLNGYVDGLETLLTTANTTSSAIAGFVDQLEGYTDGIEANQATTIARLEQVRDRLPTSPSVARTTSFINTATTGTIAAGANSVAIANIGNAAGLVKGVSLPAGAAISFGANGGDTLDAISYNATGSTFLITTVT